VIQGGGDIRTARMLFVESVISDVEYIYDTYTQELSLDDRIYTACTPRHINKTYGVPHGIKFRKMAKINSCRSDEFPS
jgi:hypothetical protein